MNTPARSGPITRRRFLSLTAVAAAVTACGVPETAGSNGGKIKAATYLPPSYTDLFPPIQSFMKTAEQESGGALKFNMFHSETLLSADQLVSGLLQGVADLVFQVSSYVSSSYPVLGVYEMPFVNDDVDETQQALKPEGPLYDLINQQLGEQGMRLIASMRLAQGDQSRALEALRASFYISPFDYVMHTRAGELSVELNNYAQALEEFEVTLALQPPNIAEANYNVASAFHALGRDPEAKRSVLRALEAAPRYEKAQELLLKIVRQ